MIDGKHCKISYHVDDNNISHVKSDVVTNIMEVIHKFFGKFTVTHGKKHC